MTAPWIFYLKEDEQLVVEGFTRRQVLNGPGRYVTPLWHKVRRRQALTLGPTEYIQLRDQLTGELRTEVGPKLYFPGPYEVETGRHQVIPLKSNQYVRLLDKRTGAVRVERGESRVYLQPTEEMVGQVAEGINIDESQAALVRDNFTGQLELVTRPQVFIPAANQEIVGVRKSIRLEEHEMAVVKDNSGRYIFKSGQDREGAFFLEPYCELVEFCWSSGIYKDQRQLRFTHLDSRPKFMWYDFAVRTQDNVELILGTTFFWQILDVARMVATTHDTTGDICSHARSAILQSVSQFTLEQFLGNFNSIVHEAVLEAEDPFYAERGVKIHAVEVRSVSCKDPATQHILQEIIEETTNRLNRLQKQESENEVALKQLRGHIEAEDLKGQLLELQREHKRIEGLIEGEAEANRVKALFEGLNTDLSLADKMAVFQTLRKQTMLQTLSEGSAQLYFTPADVDLSIEARA
jgi:regulator of protease activity HflC (stomatin/prohibitin superfamily)